VSGQDPSHESLPSDPGRQAVATLRAYSYQIWRTIERWVSLKSGEILFIERAEDFDVAEEDVATAVQVKDTDTRISLASKDARDAILNFWKLQKRAPRNVRFQFLTRASIATEQGELLGRRPGIELWREAARGVVSSCELLRTFLVEKFSEQADFKAYLKSRTSEELIGGLFRSFEWTTDEPDANIVQAVIRRRLIEHGAQHSCGPSMSARVVSDLHMHCWEVAKRPTAEGRSLTREDFLFLFEKATAVLLPLRAFAGAVNPATETASALSLAVSLHFWTDVPPLPNPVLPRERAVATAVSNLSVASLLVLAGSVGKGKTTLAKLVALASRRECLWVDLSGRESPFAEAALIALALNLEDRGRSFLVIIDDFLIEPTSPQGLWTSFAMLQRACKRSGSQLLATTKGIPQERLDARLTSAGALVQPLEDLNEAETKDLLERLGCPSAMSGALSVLTLAQTGGHPKLVHVRALDLRDQDWPKPSANMLARTPASIAGQRENERLNVAQRESGPKLDFLYHLTLLTLPFDRNLALRLGSKIDGLSDPGTALDSYLGRWIEPFIESYFRVTSLLTNEAQKAWPPKKVKEAHARIFDSFLDNRVIDSTHVFSVLMHAYSAESPVRLGIYINSLVDRKDRHFPLLAKELKLLLYFGSGVGFRAAPFSAHISLMLRLLQFRVASVEDPEELSRIANEWLWEVENLPPGVGPHDQEYLRLAKTLWASSIATQTEGDLPPQLIIRAIVTFDTFNALGAPPQVPAVLKSESGFDDMMTILFGFFQARCKTVEYLDRLLDALADVTPAHRSRMLEAFNLPYFLDHTFVVEGAWIGELKKETPNWTNVNRILEKTKQLAKQWNAIRLGLSAVKVQSIVFDEHLNDRDAGIAALENGRNLFGEACMLDEQLANIHYRHGEADAAIAIWDKSLALQADAARSHVTDPFAFRKGGIAVGGAANYSRAAELFLWGSRWAKEGALEHTASGLKFDAAYAFYKAKKLGEMCLAMRDGLEQLAGSADPEAEFNRFALQKLAGHVVLWIRNELVDADDNKQAEPILGCCSNPNYDQGLKQSPPSPTPLTITHVVELEHRLRLALETERRFGPVLRASNMPVVAMKLAMVELEQIYRQRRFADLLAALDKMKHSLERARAQHRVGQSFLEEFHGSVEIQDEMQLGVEYFLLSALTLHIVVGDTSDLIATWRDTSLNAFAGRYATAIDNAVSAIAATSDQAGYVLRNASIPLFSRLVGAHVVLVSPPVVPDLSTYAQAAYITWLSKSDVKGALREILPALSASFGKTWKQHLLQPALLNSPKVTIPEIEAAVAYQPEGAEKTKRILHAASAATSVRIPPDATAWLESIARQEEKLVAKG
jgi:hypothetical protein